MDHILDVVLRHKENIKNNTYVEQKNIPCKGILFDNQVCYYSILADGLMIVENIKTENLDDDTIAGEMYMIFPSYLMRMPNEYIGLTKYN
jgi:hypothetical protein